MESRNVILVGFMGAGKSAVGRLLARRIGLCFVETDDMIVAREGRSIPEIFAQDGEARFRALEAETLDSLADKRGHVIATGGGFPCRDGVMERLRAMGTVVWLAADFDRAFERASRLGGRPMLGSRTREQTHELFEARKAYYSQAHLAVDSNHPGIDGVVNRILRHLHEREQAGLTPGARARSRGASSHAAPDPP